ncbi:hypothetical protein [Streptomyces lydicus]|uniref:hypothetical protein n=1 Tax=Streptomyces lydicus TaxID=47763 RepID=UPI00379DE77B
MLRHRLHAAATAVVMRPLEVLVDVVDRAVYAWRRWRSRRLHNELARLAAADEAATVTAAAILRDAHLRLAPLYDTAPHPTV